MNNIEPNFFLVNRGLLHSDRWLSEKFTRGQAWVDLFGLAQHTKSYFRVRGIRVNIERGQLAYSQLTLAKRWKWSRDKVRRYLSELEKDEDIEQQNNKITTVITILKYNLWQGIPTPNKTTSNTTNKQQKNIKQDTYNNDNNDNNTLSEEISVLIKEYLVLVKSRRSTPYILTGSDKQLLKLRLGQKLPVQQILAWYFTTEKSQRHHSLAAALSNDSLNAWREAVKKKSWNEV